MRSKVRKSQITAMTRDEFDRIVYGGMLSEDETRVLDCYIRNKSVDETTIEYPYMSHKTVARLRAKVRKKLDKLLDL